MRFVVIKNASIDSHPQYDFDVFSTFFPDAIFMRFRFDPLIQKRCQIDVFSMKTLSVLVWTEGLNASKCMRFETKTY